MSKATLPLWYRPLTEARKRLLAELEQIIGDSTYHSKIQNWGPGGVFLGEGRRYRYPVTVVGADGEKSKSWSPLNHRSDAELKGAHYAFGANNMHIGMALIEAIDLLERKYGLDLERPSASEDEQG